MTACTEECRARVECTTCRRIKKPIGRDGLWVNHDLCDSDCPGYMHPHPPHLWPGEDLPDEP